MLNPDLTRGDGWAMALSAGVGLALATYMTVRAWRSTAEQWRAFNLQCRPRSWNRWPIYGHIWRDFDRHTIGYLWLARILGVLAVVMGALGLAVGIAVVIRG
jgi:hypothetical protein